VNYLALKHLHITCVILSITLFMIRGALTLRGAPWRQSKVLRIAPHIIDTVLLGSAIWMTTLIQQYPFTANWLTAKLLALLGYIAFGKIALGKNTPASRRAPAVAAALLCVSYIVGVALTKSVSWGM